MYVRFVQLVPLLALVTSMGCARKSAAPAPHVPPAPPPAPAVHVPPGCEASLAGAYHHQDDDTFRYDATDDGRDVVIQSYRQFGANKEIPDGGATRIELHRTVSGFHGEARGTAQTLSGKTCQVSFPYEVTACTAASFSLRTMQELGLKEDCSIEADGTPDMADNVLVRDAPVADGGAPRDLRR